MNEAGRVLAVDTGGARIGIAISDPTGTIARPLTVIVHTSRRADVERVAALAEQHSANRIVVGVPYGIEERIGHQARAALRFVEDLRHVSPVEIHTWDESGSTQTAESAARAHESLDAVAAAVILQEYLNAHKAR